MKKQNENGFSNVTKTYLAEFYRILDEMIAGMTGAALTDSISHDFIVQMIPHHRAAIEMSQNILRYTTNIPLQEIAENIIKEQTQSIADMQAALANCGKFVNSETELSLFERGMDHIMQTMFSDMENARTANSVDCDFMWEMIPHHRGAVEMSELVLHYDICPELKPIVRAILTSQTRGIRQMQQLLRRLGC